MFGEYINEYTLDCSLWRILTGVVLFWLNVVLAAAAFAAMLWLCGKREQTGGRLPKLFLVLFYAVLMGGFYQLSAAEPFTCSMNYRYITPTCVIGAVFLGLAFQRLRNGKSPCAAGSAASAGHCAAASRHVRRRFTSGWA